MSFAPNNGPEKFEQDLFPCEVSPFGDLVFRVLL
jgi:hypothetical protein